MAFLIALAVSITAAVGLVVVALQHSVVYFYAPSQIVAGQAAIDKAIRIGGLVKPGSVVKTPTALRFVVTDGVHDVPVVFHGLLPALFAEGQGVVAAGRLDATRTFLADQVLAKHDERYMPPEVVSALKKNGRWKEGQ